MSDTETRTGTDEFGVYVEERTARGWRKVRRTINDIEFSVCGSKTNDYIMALEASGVYLRMNDMSDRIEYDTGAPVSDAQLAVMLNRMRDLDLKDIGRMKDAIVEAAVRNRYHPIRDYLQDLTWDGRDHFGALMSKLTMTSPIADVFWRKWLIGSVAKIFAGGQNFMLVLLGGQNKGKSRLARWLCPMPEMFYEGPINPDDKDSLVRLMNHWIWEVAELESTTKRSERAALKHFITTQIVTVRQSYGRTDTKKPASASLLGTINEDGTGFLNDTTGNRRYGVIHIADIDWSYENIDINQLWAQIYAAYLNGEQWELSQAEREIQAEINSGHMISSPVEELLLQYFDIDPSNTETFSGTMDILEKLQNMGLRGDQFRNKMEVASVLTKMGLTPVQKRADGRRIRGYAGIQYKGESMIVI